MLQFELLVHGAVSLKDKRSVIRSVKDRLHREHQVSVAEVALQDKLNVAVLGMAVAAADGKRASQVMDKVTEKLRKLTDAELGDCHRELIHGRSPDEHGDELHEGVA